MSQSFNLLNSIAFKPNRLEISVLLKTLYLSETYAQSRSESITFIVQVQSIVQMRSHVLLILLALLLQKLFSDHIVSIFISIHDCLLWLPVHLLLTLNSNIYIYSIGHPPTL